MAAGIARLGDKCTGHCFPSRPNIAASTNVFANGIGIHRMGDAWTYHTCGKNTHAGVLAAGSRTVFVNGLPVGRIGDPVSCGSSILTGSANVFAGG